MEKKASDYIEFYIGVIAIAAGLFFLLSKAVVRSGFYTWTVGGLSVSSGVVIIQLMAGVRGLVHNPKSFFAKLITIAGSIFIVSSNSGITDTEANEVCLLPAALKGLIRTNLCTPISLLKYP